MMARIIRIVQTIFLTLVFILALLLAGNALSYFNFDPTYSFLKLKQDAIATGWYLPAYYSHVLTGGIILVIGFIQLIPAVREKHKRLHKGLGYFYVLGILFFSAPGGLVMSFFIDRGIWVQASFLLQVTLWFYFTAQAFSKIRQGDITNHQYYMWRSYALTLAAITLRIYIFMTAESYNLAQPQAYATIAWLSWVPNWMAAEVCIKMKVMENH